MKQSLLFSSTKRSREESDGQGSGSERGSQASTQAATTHASNQAEAKKLMPLAARMRPEGLEEFRGQGEAVPLLAPLLSRGVPCPSIVLWGPPGCGKTSFLRLLARARADDYFFKSCSAVTTGAPELRKMMEEAVRNRVTFRKQTAVFVDEIHRLNKAQQDVLLPFVEDGVILLGATTENPSFALNTAVLSRSKVVPFRALATEQVLELLRRALRDDTSLGGVAVPEEALAQIASAADGDARTALNSLEMAASLLRSNPQFDVMRHLAARSHVRYDKAGDEHFDLISALHKSMRGGDANAAVYWCSRMLVGGEKPEYIARRLVRFASEDVGLADSTALPLAIAAMDACKNIGMPECSVSLCHAAAYLALAPKSVAVYSAMNQCFEHIRSQPNLPPPLTIRNAPTQLMTQMGYGVGYVYTPGAVDEAEALRQCYLPDAMKDKVFLDVSALGSGGDFGQKWKLQRKGL
jgi:putative ATPase